MHKDTGGIVGFNTQEEKENFFKKEGSGAYCEVDPELLTPKERSSGQVEDEEVKKLLVRLAMAKDMDRPQRRRLLKDLKKLRKRRGNDVLDQMKKEVT